MKLVRVFRKDLVGGADYIRVHCSNSYDIVPNEGYAGVYRALGRVYQNKTSKGLFEHEINWNIHIQPVDTEGNWRFKKTRMYVGDLGCAPQRHQHLYRFTPFVFAYIQGLIKKGTLGLFIGIMTGHHSNGQFKTITREQADAQIEEWDYNRDKEGRTGF